MDLPNNTVEQLAAALKGLLNAEDADGRRILYQEDADGDHGYCQVCKEVDGHNSGCPVEGAQRVLRLMQEP